MAIHSGKATDKERVPITVELKVSNFKKSLDFYTKVLGFTLHRIDENHNFAILEFNGGLLMIQEKRDLEKRNDRSEFFIKFMFPQGENLGKYYKDIQAKGAEIIKPLEDMAYGQRRFYTKDPDGYQIKFAC